jgi:putative transposase
MKTVEPSHGGPRSVVASIANGRDNALPSRGTPSHQPVFEVFNRTSIVFVTVCAQDRKPLFNRPDIHTLMAQTWTQAGGWMVGRYVLMPDHVHLFCTPGTRDFPPLRKWIQFWKSKASRVWLHPKEQPIWQKSFWDTQLRKGDSYADKWEYVRQNPVRAGLCGDPDEWPFQGELNTLSWHD